MLSVTIKCIMLNVVMLNVAAPVKSPFSFHLHFLEISYSVCHCQTLTPWSSIYEAKLEATLGVEQIMGGSWTFLANIRLG